MEAGTVAVVLPRLRNSLAVPEWIHLDILIFLVEEAESEHARRRRAPHHSAALLCSYHHRSSSSPAQIISSALLRQRGAKSQKLDSHRLPLQNLMAARTPSRPPLNHGIPSTTSLSLIPIAARHSAPLSSPATTRRPLDLPLMRSAMLLLIRPPSNCYLPDSPPAVPLDAIFYRSRSRRRVTRWVADLAVSWRWNNGDLFSNSTTQPRFYSVGTEAGPKFSVVCFANNRSVRDFTKPKFLNNRRTDPIGSVRPNAQPYVKLHKRKTFLCLPAFLRGCLDTQFIGKTSFM
jgi:hypothetical protein